VLPNETLLVPSSTPHGKKDGMEFLQEELGKERQVFQGEKGKTISLE